MGHCFISEEKEQPGESIERGSVYERGKGMGKGETGVKSLTPLHLCFPIYNGATLPTSKNCHDTKIINIYYTLKTGPGTKPLL